MTSNFPNIGDGPPYGPYFFFAFGPGDALFEPHIGSYSNNFRGPDSPDLPVDFAVYDTDITRGPWSERVFSGRFCFALRGVIPGGPTPASCDALIDGALAPAPDVSLPAVPVPAALPLAISGLALLAGLRWRRTRAA